MAPPRPSKVRHRVDPGDVPPEKAARRLHLTLEEFMAKLPELRQRGFPETDPTTGMYDLEEIDRWRKERWRHAQPRLTSAGVQGEPDPVVGMGERFRAAKERKRDDRAA